MLITTSCQQCKNEFLPTRHGYRFCSTKCWYDFTKDRRTAVCPGCNQPFEKQYKSQKTCSDQCRATQRRADRTVVCQHCKNPFERPHGKTRQFCSRRCHMLARVEHGGTSQPEGTLKYHSNGYVLRKTGHRWVMLHRWKMEQHLKRKLEPHERVHHKNGRRDDNRIRNLELWKVKKKDPAGVRAADYHCPGCRCFVHR